MFGHPVRYEKVIAYAAGELAEAEAGEVAAHLAGCPACAATVARYRAVQATVAADDSVAPPPALVDRVKARFPRPQERTALGPRAALRRVVATLTFDSRGTASLAGARGAAGAGYQLAFASEGADVDLEVTPLGNGCDGRWQLFGQVAVDEANAEPAPIRVALVASGSERPVAETVADAGGIFAIEAAAGQYDLLVGLANRHLVLAGIQVG